MAVTHVLDGGAASRYSEGDPRVVQMIRTARLRGHRVVVPASCLAEAYSAAASDELAPLDRLGSLESVIVAPLRSGDTPVVDAAAKHVGGVGLGHAVIEAMTHGVRLVTDKPDSARRVLRDTMIEPR